MKFTLDINMDNAAFTEWPENELARILKDLTTDILCLRSFQIGNKQPVRDVNGNTVGGWKIARSRARG